MKVILTRAYPGSGPGAGDKTGKSEVRNFKST